MLVMTARVHKKKLAIILAAIVVAVTGLVILLGGQKEAAPTSAAASVANNDDRVKFLNSFGWEVTTSPTHSSQVRIPSEPSEVFERYNDLQKSQGYDLSAYSGQTVMRYVYEVNNYPGATEPVYATVLIRRHEVIGGDVTDTAAKGMIHGFQKPKETAPTDPSAAQQDHTTKTSS